jgi:hypothetical protein
VEADISLMEQFEKMPLTISRVKHHVGHQRMYCKVSCGRDANGRLGLQCSLTTSCPSLTGYEKQV